MVLDTGDYPALLAAAEAEAARLGYPAIVAAGRGAGRRRGLGLAVFLEKSGLGPQDTADVVVSEAGNVHVFSGGTSLGQGIETVLAQIAADALGVGLDAVHVVERGHRPAAVRHPAPGRPAPRWSPATRCTRPPGGAPAGPRQLAARMLEAAEDDLVVGRTARSASAATRGPRSRLAQIARAAAPASKYLRPGRARRAGRAPPFRRRRT